MRYYLVLSVFLPVLAATQDVLTPEAAVAAARASGPLAQTARGTRLLTGGRARAEAAWPNPIAEWRRENFTGAIEPDVFATLQVPVDITGRRVALLQAARTARQRGLADSAAVDRQLTYEVLRAYWRASLARELATIAEAERDARVGTSDYDQRRFQEGAIAEVVALRASLEADRARIAAVSAQQEWGRAAADLARLLGTTTAAVSRLATLTPPSLDPPGAADTSWTSIVQRRPDLRAAELAVREAERRSTAESRGRLGDLNVVGGYKGTAGFNTGLIGVLVPLPLFNRNDGPRERTRGEFLLARAAHLDAEWRARGDVAAAAAAWSGVIAAARDGATTLDARATEVAAIAEAAYREGATSFLELLEAQRARADARATAARWAHDAQLARL